MGENLNCVNVGVGLSEEDMKVIDNYVKSGRFSSRAEFARFTIRKYTIEEENKERRYSPFKKKTSLKEDNKKVQVLKDLLGIE